ncbi:MAG: hypothetical protein ACRCZ0_08330 [Cetobacterium sp.]
MIKKTIIGLCVLSSLCLGANYKQQDITKDVETLFSIVSDTHEVRIGENVHKIDLRVLMKQTAMVESNFGRDKYAHPRAKTYMQMEEPSARWYVARVPKLKEYIEFSLGRRLVWDDDRDAMFNAYLVYMGKLQTHGRWLDKFSDTEYFTGDIEWYVYKIMYNSIVGASKFERWESRRKEYYKMVDNGL